MYNTTCKVNLLYSSDERMSIMSKDLQIGMLMDFYGQLLTKKQAEALELYYNQDLSLLEIAEDMGISRQGARDFIKRGESQLTEYENVLGLAKRFEDARLKVSEIKALAAGIENCGKIKNRIIELSDDILKDF